MAGYRLMPSIIRIISSFQLYNYFIAPFIKIRQDLSFVKNLKLKNEDSIQNFEFKKKSSLKT